MGAGAFNQDLLAQVRSPMQLWVDAWHPEITTKYWIISEFLEAGESLDRVKATNIPLARERSSKWMMVKWKQQSEQFQWVVSLHLSY